MIFGRVDPRRVWRQDWAQRVLSRAPHGAVPFLWSELSAVERKYVEIQIDSGRYPGEVSPFWDEDNIARDISLGLRGRGGVIVGWLVCHTVPQSPGTIRYSRSFSSRAADVRGNGAWLIARALDLHVKGHLLQRYPTALFDIVCENRPMLALYQRRLEPHLDEIYESRVSTLAMLPR
jgi:hypothetical protein